MHFSMAAGCAGYTRKSVALRNHCALTLPSCVHDVSDGRTVKEVTVDVEKPEAVL